MYTVRFVGVIQNLEVMVLVQALHPSYIKLI